MDVTNDWENTLHLHKRLLEQICFRQRRARFFPEPFDFLVCDCVGGTLSRQSCSEMVSITELGFGV
jgi:hypothetical protein